MKSKGARNVVGVRGGGGVRDVDAVRDVDGDRDGDRDVDSVLVVLLKPGEYSGRNFAVGGGSFPIDDKYCRTFVR